MANEVETGEGTSKNALKKLQKAEEAAKKKAAKDEEKKAKKASEPEKATKIGADAEELDPTQYYENRMKAIAVMEVHFLMMYICCVFAKYQEHYIYYMYRIFFIVVLLFLYCNL